MNNLSFTFVSEKEFYPIYNELRPIVFAGTNSVNYSIYWSEEENKQIKKLRAEHKQATGFYLFCKDQDKVVAWSFGWPLDFEEFYMCNSGVLEAYRRKGIYNQLLTKMVDKARSEGFQIISSNHTTSNNAILIPKLKFGFKIIGMEIKPRFGLMIKLCYYTNENVAKVIDYRSGFIQNLPYNIRKAAKQDMDSIFRMGFDVWNEGANLAGHFERCYSSPKYAKGTFYLLENSQGVPVSSLIAYPFPAINGKKVLGLGTIATTPAERKKGYAEKLIRGFISFNPGAIFYLWSDIGPDYYEKFGFEALPTKFQIKPESTVMIRAEKELSKLLFEDTKYSPPEYF